MTSQRTAESDVLDGVGLAAAYQPVIHLDTGHVVGFEALARGPLAPEGMLDVAREAGRVAEFDWRCRDAAFAGALDAGLGNSLTLFVNVEPDTRRACRRSTSSASRTPWPACASSSR